MWELLSGLIELIVVVAGFGVLICAFVGLAMLTTPRRR